MKLFESAIPTPRPWFARVLPWLLIAGVIIGLDQVSKFWILANFEYRDVMPITGFFNIVRAHNPGAAFSFLAGASGWQREFFIGVALVATVLILWQLGKYWFQRWYALSLSMILGGALGNVIDRWEHGYVVDFLDFHIAGWHWPAFNLADSAIVGGAILLVVDEFIRTRQNTSN